MYSKKIMSMLLVIVLLLSLMATGCSKTADDETTDATATETETTESSTTETTEATTEDTEPKVEPIEFTVFIGDPRQQPTEDNKIYKLIEEKLGVTFNFEFLVGDLDQKLGVLIAGGEYPDLLDSANSTEKSINAGVYIPIQDYITAEKTPNLWRQYGEYMNMMKSEDGNVYILPNYGMYYNDYVQTSYNGPAFWIQKQLLIDMNYPKITTLDEYFDVLKAYKEKQPEINGQPTVGFEVLSFDWRAFCLKNAPAQLAGSPNDGGAIVDPATGKASLYANTDIAKTYYSKLNQAYNDGLIEADTFVQNYDEYLARLSSGRVLGMFDQGWDFQTAADALVSQGLDNLTWVPLGITFDSSIEPWYRDRPVPNYNRGIGITVDNKNPERYIQMIETLLSDEWQKIFAWGIEGEDYLVDDKGMFYRTPEQRANNEDVNWRLANKAEAIWSSIPKIQGKFDDGNDCDPNSQASEYFEKLKDIDKQILNAYGYVYYTEFLGDAPENRKDYPAWQISLGDGTDAAIADAKINELQMKYLPQLILGKTDKFDADWAAYVKEYDSVNIQAYIDRVNEGLQERRDKW